MKKLKARVTGLTKRFLISILAIFWLGVFLVVGVLFVLKYHGRIYPRTHVLGHSVSGMTPDEAVAYLSERVVMPDKLILMLVSDEERITFEIDTEGVGASYNFEETVRAVFRKGRSGKIGEDLKEIVRSLRRPIERNLDVLIDEEKLREVLSVFAGQVGIEPVMPGVSVYQREIVVEYGQVGEEINIEALQKKIVNRLEGADFSVIEVKREVVDPRIDEEAAMRLMARAEVLVEKSMIINFEYERFEYGGADLLALLAPRDEINEEGISKISDEIGEQISREPQNPMFVFDGGRVSEFAPAKDGVNVLEQEFVDLMMGTLRELESGEEMERVIEVPVALSPPEFQTQDVNDMGIKEQIGRGVSTYRGSISSRIYNINLAASRLNGKLIKPGEYFSFNAALGDVSEFTGYKQAYIIKDGKTILGDGGGVCQVSTTFFRAALDAGLPIIERRAHAYRVGYYEQGFPPGLDATVYSPTTDLKIKNDTPGHILIQATANNRTATLVFELYGTSDGRVATTSKPIITDSTPPPEDVYEDDPTLPAGEIKQVEYKAWGAKVVFNYNVARDDETIYKKTFYSNYKPWGNVFLRGTGG